MSEDLDTRSLALLGMRCFCRTGRVRCSGSLFPVPGSRCSTMSYAVKEIYYTLQGEGMNAGRPAVFCRFAGCNLWSGRESDRATATCGFCDTDFVGTDGPGVGQSLLRRRTWGERVRG